MCVQYICVWLVYNVWQCVRLYIHCLSVYTVFSTCLSLCHPACPTTLFVLEKFWRISLDVTDDAIAKLYVMKIFIKVKHFCHIELCIIVPSVKLSNSLQYLSASLRCSIVVDLPKIWSVSLLTYCKGNTCLPTCCLSTQSLSTFCLSTCLSCYLSVCLHSCQSACLPIVCLSATFRRHIGFVILPVGLPVWEFTYLQAYLTESRPPVCKSTGM